MEKINNDTRFEGSQDQVVSPDANLVSTIDELKRTRVSKEEYDRVIAINKDLTDRVLNGSPVEEVKAEPVVDTKELEKALFSEDSHLTNLDYWKNALALREERLKKHNVDIFNPKGSIENEEAVERLVEGVQFCIDGCDNNPERFNGLLSSIIKGK